MPEGRQPGINELVQSAAVGRVCDEIVEPVGNLRDGVSDAGQRATATRCYLPDGVDYRVNGGVEPPRRIIGITKDAVEKTLGRIRAERTEKLPKSIVERRCKQW